MKTATELWEQFSKGSKLNLSDFIYDTLPGDQYKSAPLTEFGLLNPKGFSVEGSVVWYPSGMMHLVKKMKIEVIADSRNCSFYFLRVARGMSIKLNGPNHMLLNLSDRQLGINIRMTGGSGDEFAGCRSVIGEATYIASARAVLLNTDFSVMRGGLWSDEVLVQGSNQHGIVDVDSKSLIGYGRNEITLEQRVWIGRRAIICAGARMGSGAILGTGAVAAKAYPGCVIVVGNPGRIVKRGRSWVHSLQTISHREMEFFDNSHRPSVDADNSPSSGSWWKEQYVSLKALAAGFAGAATYELLTEIVQIF